MELEPFFYYFVITKKLNLSNEKWKLVYLDQYSRIKYIKGYMRQWYPHHTIRKKNIVAILHIHGARAIFLLLYDNPLYLFLINSLNLSCPTSEFVGTCFWFICWISPFNHHHIKRQSFLWENDIHTKLY